MGRGRSGRNTVVVALAVALAGLVVSSGPAVASSGSLDVNVGANDLQVTSNGSHVTFTSSDGTTSTVPFPSGSLSIEAANVTLDGQFVVQGAFSITAQSLTVGTAGSTSITADGVEFATTGAITVTGGTSIEGFPNVANVGASEVTLTSADGDITLEEHAQVVAANGNVLITSGGDLVAGSGSIITAANNVTLESVGGSVELGNGLSVTALGTVPASSPADTTGTVVVKSDGDVTEASQAALTAGTGIQIYGDALARDTAGADITLAGTLGAPLIQVFGNIHNDTFNFDGTQLHGLAFAYGGNAVTPLAGASSPVFGPVAGDNTFNVVGLPPASGASAGNSITLDGQTGTDTYNVWTHGSRTGPNNYVVNVLPTDAPNSGEQTLNVYGSQTAPAGGGTNDVFLLRDATTSPLAQEPYPNPAFVAVLDTSIGQAAPDPADGLVTAGAFAVERVNYDSAIDTLNVYGPAGNDVFAVDGAAAQSTTLHGGTGNEIFQLGQIYGLPRTSDPAQGNLTPADSFAFATSPTPLGLVSHGNGHPLTAEGGVNDTFDVYGDEAPLSLVGGTGANTFVVHAFALAQAGPYNGLQLGNGCTGLSWPWCLPLPVPGTSISAPVTVVGGPGANHVVTDVPGQVVGLTPSAEDGPLVPAAAVMLPREANGPLFGWVYTAGCAAVSQSGPLQLSAGQTECLGPQSVVNGPVTVGTGEALNLEGATITGPLKVEGGVLRMCDSRVTGSVTVESSPLEVVIGDEHGIVACAGNAVSGPVRLTDNTAGVAFDGNTVTGPVNISGTTGTLPFPETGSVEAADDTVHGPFRID